MTKTEVLEKTKQVLEKYLTLGLEQLEIYKEINPGKIPRTKVNGRMMGKINGIFMPIEDVTRRVGAQEEVFVAELIKSYWDYYLLNIRNIDSTARQGIDRTLQELCYQKFITFVKSDSEKKKRIVLITNICDIGMILAFPSKQDEKNIPQYTADYNFWVSKLTRVDDKNRFQELQTNGYPTHSFADAKNKLWPSFYEAFKSNEDDVIFPRVENNDENLNRAKDSFLRQYQHQHDFVHGSHLSAINALQDQETKQHIFMSFALSTQSAYQTLHTVNEVLIQSRKLDLTLLNVQTAEVVPGLIKYYSHFS